MESTRALHPGSNRPRRGVDALLHRRAVLSRERGVCRTDLHITGQAETPSRRRRSGSPNRRRGGCWRDATTTHGNTRRSILGRVDRRHVLGCRNTRENLCDAPVFTGYDVDAEHAENVDARADVTHPLPAELDDLHAAPLLCAGVIGFERCSARLRNAGRVSRQRHRSAARRSRSCRHVRARRRCGRCGTRCLAQGRRRGDHHSWRMRLSDINAASPS